MKSDRSQQFGQLRARIEATFAGPALLVVTSAVRGDGKTVTAFGLAESLAVAHHRVLLIDANSAAPSLARMHQPPTATWPDVSRATLAVAQQRFSGLSLADERFETGTSIEAIKTAVAGLRTQFDFIIVDTAPLIKSDLAVLFSTVADGTLLTLRLGRLPSPADEQTMSTLNRVGANVAGLLTVTPAMIKGFGHARPETVQPIRVPVPRHVTSRHTVAPEMARSVVEPVRATVISESKIVG